MRHKKHCEVEFIDEIIIIEEVIYHRPQPHLVLTTLINNSKFQIMTISLLANQKIVGTLALIDSVTQSQIQATFSATTCTSDNQAALLGSVDSNGDAIGTGVAAGTGNLTVATTAAYTDSTGAPQSAQVSSVIPFMVTAAADGVTLQVNFAAPIPQ